MYCMINTQTHSMHELWFTGGIMNKKRKLGHWVTRYFIQIAFFEETVKAWNMSA